MAPEYVKESRYNNNFNNFAIGVDEFNNVGPARTPPQRQLSFCCALVLVLHSYSLHITQLVVPREFHNVIIIVDRLHRAGNEVNTITTC